MIFFRHCNATTVKYSTALQKLSHVIKNCKFLTQALALIQAYFKSSAMNINFSASKVEFHGSFYFTGN